MEVPHPELGRAPQERLATIEREVLATPEIAGFQSYESFVSDNARKKEAFIATETGNLDLAYPRLAQVGLDELVQLAHATEASLVTLIGSEKDAHTEALFDAIEYRQSEMFMVSMAARMHDNTLPPEERAEAAEWFQRANESLYGVPENSIFSAIARERFTVHMDAAYDDETARTLQQQLRARTGTITDEGRELHRPSDDATTRFAHVIRQKFDPLIDHITDEEKVYELAEVVEAIRETLRKIGAEESGWCCGIVPGKELLSVSAHKKLVEVGENREPMGAAELRAKIIHEVGFHVLRSVNAQKAGWLSAAYGQQKYLDFEESLANAAGSVYWGSESTAKPEYRYLAHGFAYGLDDHEPRDIRDTYEVLWRTVALDSHKPGTAIDIEKAKKDAFLQCVRIYRGTPTDIPGLTYNKDLAYVHGRELVGPVIELLESIDDLELLLAGKLDPTKADHLPIAEAIVPDTQLAGRIREHFALAA